MSLCKEESEALAPRPPLVLWCLFLGVVSCGASPSPLTSSSATPGSQTTPIQNRPCPDPPKAEPSAQAAVEPVCPPCTPAATPPEPVVPVKKHQRLVFPPGQESWLLEDKAPRFRGWYCVKSWIGRKYSVASDRSRCLRTLDYCKLVRYRHRYEWRRRTRKCHRQDTAWCLRVGYYIRESEEIICSPNLESCVMKLDRAWRASKESILLSTCEERS